MVQGYLTKILDGKFSGSFYFKTLSTHISLDGLTIGRDTVPIDLPKPIGEDLESAILEIAVLSPTNRIDWRVRVNGINIIKEFKPFSTIRIGNVFFTKHVYDVTWLLKTPDSLGRRCVNVTFRREGGDPFVVKQVSLGLIYGSPDSHSEIEYYTGGLGLEPGEKMVINTSGINDSYIDTSLYLPSKQATVKIRSRGLEETISNALEVFNLTRRIENPVTQFEFEHVETRETYNPKSVVISNFVIYKTTIPKPLIVFEKIEYDKGFLTIRIRNAGESKPEQLVLTIISRGNTLLTKKIPLLKPGEQYEEKCKLNLPAGENDLIIRTIWRKVCSLEHNERRVKIVLT
ncbi:MAG: hypothetical protein QXM54_03450 [Desulfurococcaceae archaeon]